MIKDILRFLLPLSALVPATFLLFFCFLILGKSITGSRFQMVDMGYILSSLLGILGYVGLLRLFMVGNFSRNKYTLVFLFAGVLSFLLALTLGGSQAWMWVLTLNEPDEWFILVWPTIISVYYIFKMILNPKEFK